MKFKGIFRSRLDLASYVESDPECFVGVGAFTPEMAEFPAQLLHERAIVVDDRQGAAHEAGDLIRAGIDWAKVRELSEITEEDRVHGGVTPVLKTVGQAAWDLAAARVVAASL